MLRVFNLSKVVLGSLVFLTIGFVVVVRGRSDGFLDPEWIDPHDWSGNKESFREACAKIESCKPCEETARPEYLRLVNSIFNPNQFRFDESTNYLYRTIHIHVTKDQIDKLQKSTDPVLMDGLISEILAQTEFGSVQLVKEFTVDVASTLWNHLPELPSLSDVNFSRLPRSRPILINFIILVLTYFVCRRYHINYLIVVFFGFVYCLYEYLDGECHNRIEINEAVEFIYGREKNPCISSSKEGWYDWLIGNDKRSKCREFLTKQRAYENQCGVIDIFHEFFTSVVMKQFKLLFTGIADSVKSISTTYGILIAAVTVYFMKDLLVVLIRSTFQYILNPTIWSRVAADINSSPQHNNNAMLHPHGQLESDLRDVNMSKVLDLANQQMKLLLEQNKIEGSTVRPSGIEILAVTESAESKSASELSPSPSVSSPTGYSPSVQLSSKLPSQGSNSSSEVFDMDDFQNNDPNDTLPSTITIAETHSNESPSDFSESNASTKSDSASLSGLGSSSNSLEILSISTNTTSSSQ